MQTFQPEHPVIRAILSGDEESFWKAEAAERQAAGVPPYGRMAGIILSGPDLAAVFDLGNAMARNDGPLRQIGAQLFGPAPAPIARVPRPPPGAPAGQGAERRAFAGGAGPAGPRRCG